MRNVIDRAMRTLATGFCFAAFGLGELILAFVIFPLMILIVRDRDARGRVSKYVIHKSFRIFVELMRVDRPGLLVLANHPTLIDVVFLISFIRQADCIVKDALLKNPFTRYAILAGGFIRNAAGGEALVERCGTSMADGNVLIIFPEGTRSDPDRMREFQRGAAHIAVRNKRDITPVMIRVREHNLGRNSRWWKVPKKRVRIEFEVGEDIPITPFIERQPEAPAAARELTKYLTSYFAEKIGVYGTA
jgi:1-acyl-sn-glycerol-3-phosphate acyltransferase